MKFKSSLLVAVLAAFTLPVLAQTAPKDPAATPGIDKRQANQQQRIDQGVKSGELTSKEAARLEKGQERVQKMEDKAKADGKVTPKERARLQKAENTQSRHIAREKHDRQHDRNHDGKKDRPARNK
jgi:Skp family chaperone for outer membrane proteins